MTGYKLPYVGLLLKKQTGAIIFTNLKTAKQDQQTDKQFLLKLKRKTIIMFSTHCKPTNVQEYEVLTGSAWGGSAWGGSA